jgi:hypothetical protein
VTRLLSVEQMCDIRPTDFELFEAGRENPLASTAPIASLKTWASGDGKLVEKAPKRATFFMLARPGESPRCACMKNKLACLVFTPAPCPPAAKPGPFADDGPHAADDARGDEDEDEDEDEDDDGQSAAGVLLEYKDLQTNSWIPFQPRLQAEFESMYAFSPHFLYRPGVPSADGMSERQRSKVPPPGVATRRVLFGKEMKEVEIYTGASRPVRRSGPPPSAQDHELRDAMSCFGGTGFSDDES